MSRFASPRSKQDALVVLVRHGESVVNVQGRMSSDAQGNPLTEKGVAQAEAIALELRKLKVGKIVSSPVLRARQTADIISRGLGLEIEIGQDDRLRERGFGKLEGKLVQGYVWRFEKGTGVETFESLSSRMNSFMGEAERGVIIAVSHGDTMRAPVLGILGLDELSGFGMRAYNTNLAIIHVKNGSSRLIAFGVPIINDNLLERIPKKFRA